MHLVQAGGIARHIVLEALSKQHQRNAKTNKDNRSTANILNRIIPAEEPCHRNSAKNHKRSRDSRKHGNRVEQVADHHADNKNLHKRRINLFVIQASNHDNRGQENDQHQNRNRLAQRIGHRHVNIQSARRGKTKRKIRREELFYREKVRNSAQHERTDGTNVKRTLRLHVNHGHQQKDGRHYDRVSMEEYGYDNERNDQRNLHSCKFSIPNVQERKNDKSKANHLPQAHKINHRAVDGEKENNGQRRIVRKSLYD